MTQHKNASELSPTYYGLQAFSDNEESNVFHGFFGRQGGTSIGVYDSLNCGFGSDDDTDSVRTNRARVAAAVGAEPENLLGVYQEHGSVCVTVTEGWAHAHAPKGDAMVTNVPGIALGVLTADCAPVLFVDDSGERPIIGAAHAGWKGALAGVLGSTIDGMVALGADVEDIRACIGPCIDRRSYEVGAEFYQQFLDVDDGNEGFFQAARKEGHFMFDLAGYCAGRLSQAGLSQVFIKDIDTYFNEGDFFSCRRAAHRYEKDYGRQISTIMIRG